MIENHYILGVTREEHDRLALQHDLWKSRAIRLWKRAGLPSNRPSKVIDLGCGPGFTTFELARYLGPKGKVVGIDLAEKYLSALRARAAVESGRTVAKVEAVNAAIDSFSLPERDFDAAYARWVFIFLSDIEAAIRNVGKHLKPGGLFLLQEYVDYGAMALYPDNPPVFRTLVDAIIRSWADRGSDANVAAKIPAVLARNGFEIVGLKTQARVGRPHQKIWRWPDSFYRNYVPILESEGYLSTEEADEFREVWAEASEDPNAFYQGPTVLDMIAKKA